MLLNLFIKVESIASNFTSLLSDIASSCNKCLNTVSFNSFYSDNITQKINLVLRKKSAIYEVITKYNYKFR